MKPIVNVPADVTAELPERLSEREQEFIMMDRWDLIRECNKLLETHVITRAEHEAIVMWHAWMWDELRADAQIPPDDFDDLPF